MSASQQEALKWKALTMLKGLAKLKATRDMIEAVRFIMGGIPAGQDKEDLREWIIEQVRRA